MVDERIEKKEIPSPSHGPVAKMMGRNFVDTIDITSYLISIEKKILATMQSTHVPSNSRIAFEQIILGSETSLTAFLLSK